MIVLAARRAISASIPSSRPPSPPQHAPASGSGGDRQGSAVEDVEPVLPDRHRPRARRRRLGRRRIRRCGCAFMYELSKTASFGIKTTEAMHYTAATWRSASRPSTAPPEKRKRQGRGLPHGRASATARASLFVSHTGEIFPSGFLPVSGGNRAARTD